MSVERGEEIPRVLRAQVLDLARELSGRPQAAWGRLDLQQSFQALNRRAESIDELDQRRAQWATHCQETSTAAQPGGRVAVVIAYLTGTRAKLSEEWLSTA
jgi:hypothetical protein